MQPDPGYLTVVANLLRLTGLDPGETPNARFRVDSTSIPRDYIDYVAEKCGEVVARDAGGDFDTNDIAEERRITGIFDILGYYVSDDKEIVIFEKAIEDWASRLTLDALEVRAVVVCHEVAHMVTHLGSGHGVEAWQKFRDASKSQKEFYAQIYTHFFLEHELPCLVKVLQSLANETLPIYQSYLDALPCPVELINELLYADRRGEMLQVVFGKSEALTTLLASLGHLWGQIQADGPIFVQDLLNIQRVEKKHLNQLDVGNASTSFEILKRVVRAKNGV